LITNRKLRAEAYFTHESRRTKRAADVWESAAFSGFFLASGFFHISNLVHAHPHAANANRSAALFISSASINSVFGQNTQLRKEMLTCPKILKSHGLLELLLA
jgi:hypothetical protein